VDFNDLSFDELDQHAMEQLVFDEGEMAPILKGHIFIEKVLETLLSNKLPNPTAFLKRTRSFDVKADLALAMGLIDEKYYSAFKTINKVRNNYAHKHDYAVSVEEVSGMKFEWEARQDQAFQFACSKSSGEAVQIATIFLCWKAILLIKSPSA